MIESARIFLQMVEILQTMTKEERNRVLDSLFTWYQGATDDKNA